MGNIGRIRGLDDEGSRDALRELDRRRPLLDLGLVRDNSDRPSAEAHTGRLVYTQAKLGVAGTLFYSDGDAWRDVVAGSSSFTAPSLTLGTSNIAGSGSSVIHHNATILAFDGTSPANSDAGAAATGSAAIAARRDHKHLVDAAAPGFTLGTSNAEGSATTLIRSDASIALFDATVPTVIQPRYHILLRAVAGAGIAPAISWL